jgi:hypothetical protein
MELVRGSRRAPRSPPRYACLSPGVRPRPCGTAPAHVAVRVRCVPPRRAHIRIACAAVLTRRTGRHPPALLDLTCDLWAVVAVIGHGWRSNRRYGWTGGGRRRVAHGRCKLQGGFMAGCSRSTRSMHISDSFSMADRAARWTATLPAKFILRLLLHASVHATCRNLCTVPRSAV